MDSHEDPDPTMTAHSTIIGTRHSVRPEGFAALHEPPRRVLARTPRRTQTHHESTHDRALSPDPSDSCSPLAGRCLDRLGDPCAEDGHDQPGRRVCVVRTVDAGAVAWAGGLGGDGDGRVGAVEAQGERAA